MVPTKEMLEAYFKEMSHNNEDLERMWFWAGVAAYAHLQSPGSEEWKKQHGFKMTEQ
jgi:hypothetical protein